MDLRHSQTPSSDDETRALNALLDAFSSAFSLDDIATAYCRANGDVNRAGDLLTELEHPMAKSNEVDSSVGTIHPPSGKAIEENSTESSGQAKSREKMQKSSASFGTVSSMLGKGSTRATVPLMNRASGKEKPPMVELPEYMRDDFNGKVDKSDSAPKRETLNNRDIEEFLFSMLGEGFKLSMDMIREVLGSCGYDIKKSMEELMSVSTKDTSKKAEDKHYIAQASLNFIFATSTVLYDFVLPLYLWILLLYLYMLISPCCSAEIW
jgi:hypothetical protein